MKIKVLFGQRVCSYPGEYAPEALEVMDEHGFDENPGWLLDKEKEAREGKEFSSVAIVTIEVSTAAISKALNPENNVKGEVVS